MKLPPPPSLNPPSLKNFCIHAFVLKAISCYFFLKNEKEQNVKLNLEGKKHITWKATQFF